MPINDDRDVTRWPYKDIEATNTRENLFFLHEEFFCISQMKNFSMEYFYQFNL